ncbi:MAG: PEP/pyruvate-binding domain-containing protein [Blastocatellia bacterium]
MAKKILFFSEIEKTDANLVGGKAINLARLSQANIPVPNGFCLTTEAFWQFLEENNLAVEIKFLAELVKTNKLTVEELASKLNSLRQNIINANLSLTLELKQALSKFPAGSRFAVRSSATSEDLESASFAGQYDTFLNISSLEEIIEKIKACFASYWNDRAFNYRSEKGIDHFAHGMSVVVQQLIDAKSAGVLFTLNPLTGNEREMVVEACWGLGEALVSGLVTPDRYLIDPFELKILEIKTGEKVLKLVSDSGEGTQEITLDSLEANKLTLTNDDVLELAKIAIEVQQEYGVPIDIEWARDKEKFYILQARSLTAFSFAPEMGQWSSANFREVMPGLVNPLSFSLSLRYDYGNILAEFLNRIGLYDGKTPVEWGRRFFGRAYWNVDIVKTAISKIPGYCERTFDITVGINPSYQGDGVKTSFTLSNILRGIPVFLRLQWMYFSFWREAAKYIEGYEKLDAQLASNDYSTFSNEALVEKTKEMIDLHYQTNRIAMTCTFLATEAQNDFRDYIEKINAKLPAEKQISVANLLTGLTQISTAGPLIELWQLASRAKINDKLKTVILSTEIENLITECEKLEEGKSFVKDLKNYLLKYAFLAPNDEDLSCARWADDNSFPLTILKNYLQGEKSENPAVAMEKQTKCQEEEQAKALKNIGLLKQSTFLSKLKLVMHYCRWREITRVPLSKTYYQCQRVFLAQGQRFVEQGILEKIEDIFWLEREELLDLLSGKILARTAQTSIKRAKLIAECYRNFNPPTIIGQGIKLQTSRKVATNGEKFVGVACSAGEVIARARVIHDLSQAAKLKAGEIMIAPHTNPGWTPLFSLAAAVVLEEGGLLSHGAVVARECGIPTVLQIKHATEIFQDGQLLRVDGSRGEVEILQENKLS